MCAKNKQEAQNPLILRCHRLMEAFAKSDDERDFYLDRLEGFIVYIDLDKPDEDLALLEEELKNNGDRYCIIPKLTFYETKKIMEGFVNEKVYDIDTKEKLLDIIQSKEARENFLEFIFDQHTEQEKWQQYYQERSRIRIIEWLRNNHFHFVFEEDLDLLRNVIEKLKQNLFQVKVGKDIESARKALIAKAKTYYSNEALNPRPKRGRPPKQAIKTEVEPQITTDIYTTVPPKLRPFLFIPDLNSLSVSTFSAKFEGGESLIAQRRIAQAAAAAELSEENLEKKLSALRGISSRWMDDETKKSSFEDEDDEDEDEDEDEDAKPMKPKTPKKKAPSAKNKKVVSPTKAVPKASIKNSKPAVKRIMPVAKGKNSKPIIQDKKKVPLKKIIKQTTPIRPLKKKK